MVDIIFIMHQLIQVMSMIVNIIFFFFLKIVSPVVIVNSIHFFQGFAQRKIQSKVLYKLLEHWMP